MPIDEILQVLILFMTLKIYRPSIVMTKEKIIKQYKLQIYSLVLLIIYS